MKKLSIDDWEDKFVELCEKHLQEEPFYPYEHLWKEGLSPDTAFQKYLVENPDYAEQFEDLSTSVIDTSQQQEFLELAKKLEKAKLTKKIEQEKEEKMSKFCPECARIIGENGVCKCGFSKQAKSSQSSTSGDDMADDWLAANGFDDDIDDEDY